jgi:hypothetical protein
LRAEYIMMLYGKPAPSWALPITGLATEHRAAVNAVHATAQRGVCQRSGD